MKLGSFPTIILLLLGGVFTTIGIVAGLVIGLPILNGAKVCEQWPQTQGEILDATLHGSQVDDVTTYTAHVTYRYWLNGNEFESDRIWLGGDYSTSNRSKMSEIISKYSVGQAVTVYYSPDVPSVAVLMPGVLMPGAPLCLLFAIGMVFLAVGSLLLVGLAFMFVRSFTGFQSEESRFPDAAFDD